MEIKQIPIGPMGNLSYLLFQPERSIAAIIDPAWEPEKLSNIINASGCKLCSILLTHGHFDHSNAAARLLELFPKAKAYMHSKDVHLINPPFNFAALDDMKALPHLPQLSIIRTPGHTAGSVCYITKNALFTGDTLFAGSCGRVDFPESVPQLMYESFKLLWKLPDETIIFPGHAYNGSQSTIGKERKGNEIFKAASYLLPEDFLRILH